MTTKREFWHLSDSRPIKSQKDLYELLQKSHHIKNVLYEPNNLNRTNGPKQYRLYDKIFERVSFSKTRISGLTFRNCIFKHCLLIGTTIEDCEFHNCQFILTNTHKISISSTYIDPKNFRKCLIKDKHQNILEQSR